jgi:hypothetical protein
MFILSSTTRSVILSRSIKTPIVSVHILKKGISDQEAGQDLSRPAKSLGGNENSVNGAGLWNTGLKA